MDNKKEEQQQNQQQYNNNQFIKGAFLTLKAAGLTDPSDDEKYSNLNGNVMRSQGLLMIFSLFWARMWEVGNFPIPTKNRWLYYGGCVFLPSIFHVGYISVKINQMTNYLDNKYQPDYYERYLSKLQGSQQ